VKTARLGLAAMLIVAGPLGFTRGLSQGLVPLDDSAADPLLPAGISRDTVEVSGQYAYLWSLPDGTQVIFNLFKQITAVFENRFYIQEPDRTRGIRVEGQTTRSVGELVRLSGTLATLAGERCLTAVQELGAAPGSEPRPMLVRASLLGGRAPDPYTPGIAGAATPYNVGLLVRVVGRVASQTSGSFMLDDGSGAIVKVYSNKTVANGSMVGATGVCGIESGAPVILTRQQSDVMIY